MSLAGKWTMTMDTPLGEQRFVWELRSEGQGWSGQMHSRAGTSPLERIDVDGSSISASCTLGTPIGNLALTFRGVASDQEIHGTCQRTYGTMPFSGVRGG